jgi:hypothetical protein
VVGKLKGSLLPSLHFRYRLQSLPFSTPHNLFLRLPAPLPNAAMPAALNLSQEYDTSHRPYPQPPLDDYKASYDDLIDDYSAPYAPNARHQTFAISTPNASHRRGQSATLQKASSSSISLKHSDDTHDDPPLYPPIGSSKEKEVDTRTIWQKVRLQRMGPPRTKETDPAPC